MLADPGTRCCLRSNCGDLGGEVSGVLCFSLGSRVRVLCVTVAESGSERF